MPGKIIPYLIYLQKERFEDRPNNKMLMILQTGVPFCDTRLAGLSFKEVHLLFY